MNLVRDKKTGKSKGFAFLKYEDQRSTVLAVDNLTGSKVLGRTLRVDHVSHYKQPKKDGELDWEQDPRAAMNVAPVALLPPEQQRGRHDKSPASEEQRQIQEVDMKDIDVEDPMYDFILQERKDAISIRKMKEKSHSGRKRVKEKERGRRSKRDRSGSYGGSSRSRSRSRRRHRDVSRDSSRSRTRKKDSYDRDYRQRAPSQLKTNS